MERDQFERIQELFLAARRLGAEQRARYLEGECAEDEALRAEVEGLLGVDVPTEDGFLESPALGEGFHLGEGSGADPGRAELVAGAIVIPDRIGAYTPIRRIGEGGFGTVYLAEQEEPVRRRVALKVIKLGMDTKQVIARFEAERQALALMDHPNIARVLDAGATDTGRPYFVMELVRGVPITAYCDSSKLTLRHRLRLFVSVCHAVQHAHQKGIIHRDIKPSNVMITLHDGRPSPKVIDFGVSKATNQRLTEHTLFTQDGQFIGTPEYMSPEQAEMSAQDVDTRSDIYSLGVLLYELLTGTTPFDGQTLRSKSLVEIQRIIREDEPRRPSTRVSLGTRCGSPAQLSRMLRGDLDWIILKALEKDRERRYDTANSLAEDVERFLADEPVAAGPPSARYRVRKFVKRNRVGVAALGAVASVLVLGIMGTSIGMEWALHERGVATSAQARAERARREAEEASGALAGANVELSAQRDEAERQARLARSVLDYVTGDLIAAVHPDQLGRDATLREWLDSASRSLGREVTPFIDEPEALVSLDHAIGSAYLELSDPERAVAHLERAYARSVESLGEGGVQSLRIAATLGKARFDRLDPEGSVALLAGAVELCRERHPEDAALLIDLLNVLVEGLDYEASYDLSSDAREEARRLAGEAVALSERAGDGRRLVNSLNRLSHIELTAGHGRESLAASARAVEAAQGAYGPNHTETIRAKRQLAMGLVHDQDRRDEAIALLREAGEATREVFGTDSRIYLMIQHEFAMQFAAMGRAREAADAYSEAIENRARVLGPDHTWTLGMRLDRAVWPLRTMNRQDEARAEAWAVLERAREVYGDEDGFTGYSASLVAGMCEQDRKHDDALRAWALAVQATRASAPGMGVVAEYARRYASLLGRMGRGDEAVDVLRGVLGEDPSILSRRVDLRSVAGALIRLLGERAGDERAASEAGLWREALDSWWLEVVDRPGTTARELDEMARRLLEGERAELRDPEAAMRVAARAVTMDGLQNAKYLATLLKAQHASGNGEGVRESAARFAEHGGAEVESLISLAWLLIGEDTTGRRYAEQGVRLARRAVEASGGHSFEPWHVLGEAQRALGLFSEELTSWSRGLEASDVPAWAHESFAWRLATIEEEELQDDAEALRQVELAFERDGGEGLIWRWRTLAMLQHANGLAEESHATWRRVMEMDGATPSSLREIARGLVRVYPVRMRDVAMGLAMAERAVEASDGADFGALQTLSDAQLAHGDRVSELETWRRIAFLDGARGWTREVYAWKTLTMPDGVHRDEAEALRVLLLEDRSDDRMSYWRTLACAQWANGLLEASRESWMRMLDHPGTTRQGLIWTAHGLITGYPEWLRDPEAAVLVARRLLESEDRPTYRSYRTLIDALHAAGRHGEEIEVWKAAAVLSDAPESVRADVAWRLLLHAPIRDPAEALRQIQIGIGRSGRRPLWALPVYALALAANGKMDEATSAWREASEHPEVRAEDLNRIAWEMSTVYPEAWRDSQSAVVLGERAAAMTNREDGRVLDTLALAYFNAGRAEDAVRTQRLAIERIGTDGASSEGGYSDRLKMYRAQSAAATR